MKKVLIMAVFCLGLCACEDILEVPDISNQQVTLLAPLNGTVVNDSVVRFSWGEVMDTEGYVVQVARPTFENAAQFVIDTTIVIDSTFVGARLSTTLSNATYEWRVKAFNSGFETEFFSSRFEVSDTTN